MIRFALRCAGGHEFEGWFRNGGDFDRQARRKLIACPDCGMDDVAKAIMAPAIARGGRGEAEPAAPEAKAEPAADPAPTAPAAPAVPAAEIGEMHVSGKMRELLREMQRHIERNADYVGPRFADEARKMHRGESDQRSIYGEASDSDAEELRDEGIEFGRIPWPKNRHDA